MATHSSVLAWRIPGTVEPGGLLSLLSPPRLVTRVHNPPLNGTLVMNNCQTLPTDASGNMPGNLENSAVATGLEKVSFHSNLKERQCQRMLELLHNCTHLTL